MIKFDFLTNKITRTIIIGLTIMLIGSIIGLKLLVSFADNHLNQIYYLTEKPIPVLEASMEVRQNSQMIRIKVLEFLSLKEHKNLGQLLAKVDELNLKIDNNIDVLEDSYLGNKEDIDRFKQTLLIWRQKRHSIIEALSVKQWDKAYEIAQRDGYAVAEFSDLTKDLNKIIKTSKDKVIEYGELAKESNNNFRMISYLFMTLLLVWVMTLSLLIVLPILRQEKNLRKEASKDFLTDIFNRKEFIRQYELQKLVANKGKTVGLILFDLDFFKAINDTYGHDCGDKALKEVSFTVKNLIRDSDVFARLGGEEFGLLIFGTEKGSLYNLSEKIRMSISKIIIKHEDKEVTITASFGIIFSNLLDSNLDQMLKSADNALYTSKKSGRNCITFSV